MTVNFEDLTEEPKLKFITSTPRYTIVKLQDTRERDIKSSQEKKINYLKGMKIRLRDDFFTVTNSETRRMRSSNFEENMNVNVGFYSE